MQCPSKKNKEITSGGEAGPGGDIFHPWEATRTHEHLGQGVEQENGWSLALNFRICRSGSWHVTHLGNSFFWRRFLRWGPRGYREKRIINKFVKNIRLYKEKEENLIKLTACRPECWNKKGKKVLITVAKNKNSFLKYILQSFANIASSISYKKIESVQNT